MSAFYRTYYTIYLQKFKVWSLVFYRITCFPGIPRSRNTLYRKPKFLRTLYTSIKIIKNEVGCRDDTVPKTGDIRRHCEVELTVYNNLPQPLKRDVGRGVAEDCQLYLAVPSCVTCFWHGVIPTFLMIIFSALPRVM